MKWTPTSSSWNSSSSLQVTSPLDGQNAREREPTRAGGEIQNSSGVPGTYDRYVYQQLDNMDQYRRTVVSVCPACPDDAVTNKIVTDVCKSICVEVANGHLSFPRHWTCTKQWKAANHREIHTLRQTPRNHRQPSRRKLMSWRRFSSVKTLQS